MNNLTLIRGESVKEIRKTLFEEGEYFIVSLNTVAISRINEADFMNGGFKILFNNSEAPSGVTGHFTVDFGEGIISYALESKIESFHLEGRVEISAYATNVDEADLVLEGVISLLLKIYERYTI